MSYIEWVLLNYLFVEKRAGSHGRVKLDNEHSGPRLFFDIMAVRLVFDA